ncbi:hypothetical protein [Bartonella bovis]|uniref:hypothetical protein n=1 Tax=Bartonella bovis TaxID=155194 RepID=UPI000C9CB6A5|nr:hypothetical protein [Bartonella bovis]
MLFLILKIIIILFLLGILLSVLPLILSFIGEVLGGIFEVALKLLFIPLIIVALPTVETIRYAFAKDKDKYITAQNTVIQKQEPIEEQNTKESIEEENTKTTITDYFYLIIGLLLGPIVLLGILTGILLYPALVSILTGVILFTPPFLLLPESIAKISVLIFWIFVSPFLLMCFAPIQHRLKLLPALFFLQAVIFLFLLYVVPSSQELIFYVGFFELYICVWRNFLFEPKIQSLLENL